VADSAVIFDVDGVLLQLTDDEEDIFFEALSKFVPTENLSRDWNSYRIRNDENIITEILLRNDLPAALNASVKSHYLALLQASGVTSIALTGSNMLLQSLQGRAALGIATANFIDAAQLRLQKVNLWHPVSAYAFGADGGGAKTDILGRALAQLKIPKHRIVYIGDNLNDVAAGLNHNVHFIGFSESALRRAELQAAGAPHISDNHTKTRALIEMLLT
jgi:phosphoglycolate phosphatase-like HAD superfamily hydrolase